MNRLIGTAVCGAFCVFAASGLASGQVAPSGPATPAAMREMAEKKAAPLVTIKFILKSDGGDEMGMFGGGDEEMEVTGTMIDSQGLVLVSNTEMGGMMSRFSRMMPGMSVPKPTDIKVLVGDDTLGVEAKVIARDSELDLAWVRVNKAPETPYTFLDLEASADLKVGDYAYTVSRAGKFFDRVPMVTEQRVSGETKKPRHLYLGIGGSLGLPVFDAAGKIVGVSTMILPDSEEMEAMAGGMFGGMGDMMAGTVLPAKEVIEATKKARESAAEAEKAAPAKDAAAPEAEKK